MRATLLLTAVVPALLGADFYVSITGNDANDGSAPAPFATLERARDAVRDGPRDEPVTVYVREGAYHLTQTFQLERRDSGTAAAPVTWRAYPGERVVLSGAVPLSGFTPWRGSLLRAAVPAGLSFRQLFYNGGRQPLARYPNHDPANPYTGGWAYADGKAIPMYQNIPNESRRTLQYKVQDARAWARPLEGEVFVFARYNWWNDIVRIASIDPETRTVTVAADCSYPIRPGDRYYVQGMFEELDAPGEWYLDSRANTLYFWPPDGARDDVTVYAPRLRTILNLAAGTEYVTFRGFTFEHSSGTAITLANTHRCMIAASTVRYCGDYNGSGISVAGGAENGVVGNDVYEIGRNGIAVSGGDRVTLTAANNYAENNYIHHTGVFYKQGVGISLSGCGNQAGHNLMHDMPRMAVLFSGNNLVIEYNHMRHVNLETSDTGVVYTGGRDWISSRGTAIRYNYMHDSIGYGQENGEWVSPYYSWGVYLDDNTGGVDVVGNIVVRAWRGLIHLHNGRDNWVWNNVFVDGKLQQAEFNGWTSTSSNWLTHLPTMIAGFNSVKDQPAWRNMRGMQLPPEQAVLPDGTIMSGNVFVRNIVCAADSAAKLFSGRNLALDQNAFDANLYWFPGAAPRIAIGGNLDLAAWQGKGEDRSSLVADPLFVNAAAGDYRLKPESPAFSLGFEPIPVDRIGPFQDELRASWPIVEAAGARERTPRTKR